MNTSERKRVTRLPLSRGASALLATAMLLLALAPMARATVVAQTFAAQVYALPASFANTPLSSASNVQAQQFVQWLQAQVADTSPVHSWSKTEVAALLHEWQASQRKAIDSPQLRFSQPDSDQIQARQHVQSSTRLSALSTVSV